MTLTAICENIKNAQNKKPTPDHSLVAPGLIFLKANDINVGVLKMYAHLKPFSGHQLMIKII
jgi:hypothetical protein